MLHLPAKYARLGRRALILLAIAWVLHIVVFLAVLWFAGHRLGWLN